MPGGIFAAEFLYLFRIQFGFPCTVFDFIQLAKQLQCLFRKSPVVCSGFKELPSGMCHTGKECDFPAGIFRQTLISGITIALQISRKSGKESFGILARPPLLIIKAGLFALGGMVNLHVAQVGGARFVLVCNRHGRFISLKISLEKYLSFKFRVKRFKFSADGREPIVDR